MKRNTELVKITKKDRPRRKELNRKYKGSWNANSNSNLFVEL
jgi:hypothetical protein